MAIFISYLRRQKLKHIKMSNLREIKVVPLGSKRKFSSYALSQDESSYNSRKIRKTHDNHVIATDTVFHREKFKNEFTVVGRDKAPVEKYQTVFNYVIENLKVVTKASKHVIVTHCKEISNDPIFTAFLNTLQGDKSDEKHSGKTNSKIQLHRLKLIFPDADPDYLKSISRQYQNKPLKHFIDESITSKAYPTRKDYQNRQILTPEDFTINFTVDNFINIIPNPKEYFADASRNVKMDRFSRHYAFVFLRNHFRQLPLNFIRAILKKNAYKLIDTFNELRRAAKQYVFRVRSTRKNLEFSNKLKNIPLLQEVAYLTHIKEIVCYLKRQQELERCEIERSGLFKVCSCCFNEEVFPKDAFYCENGCITCRSCILQSVEISYSDGKLVFPCLANCSAIIKDKTLALVLPPKLSLRIAQKRALAEVKIANIPGLEMCPFCDFAAIPDDSDTIFACANPECMKESCRICKEPSHAPLQCHQVEKSADVKMRTFIENRITEALLRTCYKCGVSFFKVEGCNMMHCTCGAKMCYICRSPVTDYRHFNGNGFKGTCPLYTDNEETKRLDIQRGVMDATTQIDINSRGKFKEIVATFTQAADI